MLHDELEKKLRFKKQTFDELGRSSKESSNMPQGTINYKFNTQDQRPFN